MRCYHTVLCFYYLRLHRGVWLMNKIEKYIVATFIYIGFIVAIFAFAIVVLGVVWLN